MNAPVNKTEDEIKLALSDALDSYFENKEDKDKAIESCLDELKSIGIFFKRGKWTGYTIPSTGAW